MKQKVSQEQFEEISKAIDEGKTKDFNDILTYRFWFKFYYLVYPLSKWFAKRMIKPNTITLLMLPSALISAMCFASQNIVVICIGAILIHFFQIFDLCDGRVARATHQTSKLGRELDYLMHVLSHPVVYISFYFLIMLTGNFSSSVALMLVLAGVVIESINRSLHNLNDAIINKLDTSSINCKKDFSTTRKITFRTFVDNFYRGVISFPYFMCIAPVVFLIEYFLELKTPIFSYFIMLQIGVNFLKTVTIAYNIMRRCLKY